MYRTDDPRFRRQLTQLSHNIENANEAAQERLYSMTEHCLKPCFMSIGECVNTSTANCFPRKEDRSRRPRPRTRGRPEASFDFYDDWEQDETDALLAWENDEMEGLLGADDEAEPARRGTMNYGTRGDARSQRAKPRRLGMPYDGEDRTYISKTSYFGFLERLPFKFGGRGVRYRPSAADLQIRTRGLSKADDESSSHGEGTQRRQRKYGRKRSSTDASERSEESYSSRGDIFPSDDEDDAVPLDDEFAMALEPSSATSIKDDVSSKKARASKRRSVKRTSSSKTSQSVTPSTEAEMSGQAPLDLNAHQEPVPTLSELRTEEEAIHAAEERDVEAKREAAQELARKRGLSSASGLGNAKPDEAVQSTQLATNSRAESVDGPDPDHKPP